MMIETIFLVVYSLQPELHFQRALLSKVHILNLVSYFALLSVLCYQNIFWLISVANIRQPMNYTFITKAFWGHTSSCLFNAQRTLLIQYLLKHGTTSQICFLLQFITAVISNYSYWVGGRWLTLYIYFVSGDVWNELNITAACGLHILLTLLESCVPEWQRLIQSLEPSVIWILLSVSKCDIVCVSSLY